MLQIDEHLTQLQYGFESYLTVQTGVLSVRRTDLGCVMLKEKQMEMD